MSHPDIHMPDLPSHCRDKQLLLHAPLPFSAPLPADATGNIPVHIRQIQEISADIFLSSLKAKYDPIKAI